MIVVDTNIIAYLVINGEHTAVVEKILVRDPIWSAPLLWRSEFRNILATYMRNNILTLPQSQTLMKVATDLLQQNEYTVNSLQVLTTAQQTDCSAYDAEFVVLAQDLGVPLITADQALVKKCTPTAQTPATFLAS